MDVFDQITPDAELLVTSGHSGTLYLWSLKDETLGTCLFELRGHKMSVKTVAVSPDSGLLATGGADDEIRLWNLEKLLSKKTK